MHNIKNQLSGSLNQFNPFAYPVIVNGLQQKLKSFSKMSADRKSAMIVSYLQAHILPGFLVNNIPDHLSLVANGRLPVSHAEPPFEQKAENKAFCEDFAVYMTALLN
jgi:hypothetical protein